MHVHPDLDLHLHFYFHSFSCLPLHPCSSLLLCLHFVCISPQFCFAFLFVFYSCLHFWWHLRELLFALALMFAFNCTCIYNHAPARFPLHSYLHLHSRFSCSPLRLSIHDCLCNLTYTFTPLGLPYLNQLKLQVSKTDL